MILFEKIKIKSYHMTINIQEIKREVRDYLISLYPQGTPPIPPTNAPVSLKVRKVFQKVSSSSDSAFISIS